MAFTDWLLNNIGRATRWRSNTPDANGCAHDCEGGVDIPLPAGTPIYAIASGTLVGNGPWKGHGVITINVPGTGKVYYQHLDVLPSFPQCTNGNCGGYTIQAGTLLGYSNADVGEVEIGINPAWGGIWGPATSGLTWVGDPRTALVALASGGNVNPTTGVGSLKPCNPGLFQCPTGEQCAQLNSDGSVIPCTTGFQGCVCVSDAYAASHTPAGIINPNNPTSILGSNIWPNWNIARIVKIVGGVLMLAGALLIAFWPEAMTAAKAAVL